MLIKGEDADAVILGDTFTKDGFDRAADGKKWTFDYMLANPPFGVEWKQQQRYIENERDTLGFSGRFGAGTPRVNDGALLFLQHMLAKMRAPQDGGSRLAIVFNGSPLFTGDAGGGESEIRRWIIENDWLEAIVALPEQLFYNTGISTYLWVLTNRKEKPRKGKVQLIDARPFWVQMEKSLGNKRRRIGDPSDKEKDPDHIGELTKIFGNFKDDETRTFTEEDAITHQPVQRQRVVSKIFDNEDFGYHKITVERPLRLNFQASAERIARLEEDPAFCSLAVSKKKAGPAHDVEVAEGKARQGAIRQFAERLAEHLGDEIHRCREEFHDLLKEVASEWRSPVKGPEIKMILAALGERDETAEICRDRDGQPEPDAELRDTETVPLKESIDAYFKREVLPHVPDAWIDTTKTKVGYEIPLNRHFYRYEPPRPLEVIEADLKRLEDDIMKMLKEVTA
jgi:type I restriction enzyme M protein